MFAVVEQYEDGKYGLLDTDSGVITAYTLDELRKLLSHTSIYGFNWTSKKPRVSKSNVVVRQLLSDIRLERELKGMGMIVKRNAPRALSECMSDIDILGDISNDKVLSTTLMYCNVGRKDRIEIPWGFEAVTAPYEQNRDIQYRVEVDAVELPSTMRVIDRYTFADCRNLGKIVLPDKVERIGAFAFAGCSSLTDVRFSDSFDGTGCGEGVFCKCESLKTIDLSGFKRIPDSMFDGCTALESVIFGKDLVEIGDNAFYNTNLQQVVLPADVHIGACAFAECKRLSTIIAKGYRSESNSFAGSGLML